MLFLKKPAERAFRPDSEEKFLSDRALCFQFLSDFLETFDPE